MKKILSAFVGLAFLSATPAFAGEEKKAEEKKVEKKDEKKPEKKAEEKKAAPEKK